MSREFHTNQEIFDFICEKLAEQKVRCVDELGRCVYNRMLSKDKVIHCAIGHIANVPPQYSQSLVGQLLHEAPILFKHININYQTEEFLCDFQAAHDLAYNLTDLKLNLNQIAMRYHLNPAKIELFTEWS